MRRATKLLLLATGTTCLAAPFAAAAQPQAQVPLIERTKLFGNPTRAGGKLSPDGKWISYIQPRDGVLNVWVAPADRPDDVKPLTAEKTRPIRQTFWSPNSRQMLYVNDKGGDENYLLYGVDVTTGAEKAYTPFEKTRVLPIKVSSTIKDRILIGVNNRDARWHDAYSLDLATGKLTLVFKNDGFSDLVGDDALTVRVAARPRPDGGSDWYRFTNNQPEAKPFLSYGLDDSLTTAPLGFTNDGKTLYWKDARGRDRAGVFAQDIASAKTTLVAESANADVEDVLFDPRTGKLMAFGDEYLKLEYKPVDPAVAADLAFLKGQGKGEFTVISQTDANDKWLVRFDSVDTPSSTWVYDRAPKKISQLYVTRPELVGAPLVKMWPVEIKARDGLTLPSFLSLPKNADANGDGKPDRAVPLVLEVHGGPWARDYYGYNPYHQWYANRGWAVLSVNYRGSTGFGKKFVSAADLQWGRKMHDDLIDAVDWAVKAGVTTADKVAISGGSYGGYAALAGATMTPDKFACAVDVVGPSNLFTLLETIPPYWEAVKLQFYKRMGDPNTAEGKALLKERSPLTYVDAIKKPLLIGQGANDPRVNVRESDQIVAAMQAKKIPVTYVLFPDEGHGFSRPVNNIAFNAVAENFLGNCLGGRTEPIGDALEGSTAQVKAGAEYVKGLGTTTATAGSQ